MRNRERRRGRERERERERERKCVFTRMSLKEREGMELYEIKLKELRLRSCWYTLCVVAIFKLLIQVHE